MCKPYARLMAGIARPTVMSLGNATEEGRLCLPWSALILIPICGHDVVMRGPSWLSVGAQHAAPLPEGLPTDQKQHEDIFRTNSYQYEPSAQPEEAAGLRGAAGVLGFSLSSGSSRRGT